MRPKKGTDSKVTEILIVEDSPTQLEQLRHLLEERDYKVMVAGNGREALAAARTQKPDLIISDIIMPEMDGFALCKRIKSKKTLKDIPVVLLTALSTAQDIIKGLQCGADNFLRKPYDGEYLLSRIEYLLMNRELRQSERVQMGLKIRFEGQEHLISSERQQILDLLISVYEEALHLNGDLEARQMELARSYQSLNGLYFIAEGLNKCTSIREVGEKTLERSAQFPGISAGWISLREGEAGFRVLSTFGLPPALARPGAMESDCFCRRKLLSGDLDYAVNILECERLQKADGETYGLRYHASIPLRTDGRTLGIINLASADGGQLSDYDLKILYGVGNQVAVALERAQLYESLEEQVRERTASLVAEVAERERAQEEVQRNLDRIRALHEIDVAITSTLDLQSMLNILLNKIDHLLPDSATVVRLINKETGELECVAYQNIDKEAYGSRRRKTDFAVTSKSLRDQATIFIPNAQIDSRISDPEFFREQGLVSYLLVPLIAKDEVVGALSFFSKGKREFSEDEVEFAQTLAGQGAIAIHNAQLYEEMAKSNAVKDDFLSVMSHELRTPLNVVMGYTAMIKDGLMGEVNRQQEAALLKISDQANDQLAMINNVLYATVLEVQKPGIDSQEMNSADFLDQVRSDYDDRLQPKGLTLQWDYTRGLPLIRTDGAKLRVVLKNLIGNAIKFTGKGVVTISAGISESAESGRWLEFKVADTGIGISKDHLPFIFEKFRQVDSSQTRLYGGVGMGLHIVKRFTELLGGTVKVESEVGKGSTFTVSIPAG